MALRETTSQSTQQMNGLMQPDTLAGMYQDDAHAKNVLNTLTWQAYWQKESDSLSLSGYETAYKGTTGILRVVERNTPPDMASGKRPGFGAHMDRLFTGIEWQRQRLAAFQAGEQTGERPPYADLVYLGINPDGLETVRGEILDEVTDGYLAVREIPAVDTQTIQTIVEKRKAFITSVTNNFDSHIPGFVGKYKDLIRQHVIDLYADHDLTHESSEGDVRRLLSRFFQTAEAKLTEAVGEKDPTSVPLSYRFMKAKEGEVKGLLTPSFDTLVDFNRAIKQGESIDMYCCPNYATEERDGVHVYTFSELGTGIGLTAERGFPFVSAVIDRSIEMQQAGKLDHPLDVFVGIADFEATEENAQLVGLQRNEFEKKLGMSLEAMAQTLGSQLAESHQTSQTTFVRNNGEEEPIGSFAVTISQEEKQLASVSFGRITDRTAGSVGEATPREAFDHSVEQERAELTQKVQSDKKFQRRLGNLLKLRLGLMTRWRDGSEPEIVRNIGEMFDEMTGSGFAAPLLNHQHLPGLTGRLNEILLGDYKHDEKDVIIKAVMVNWLDENQHIEEIHTARNHLLVKVARQGAEYVTMTGGKMNVGGPQIVADSGAVWQTFGDENVPFIVIKGGYEGA